MGDWWSAGVARLGSHWELSLPLLLSLWMAGMDLASRRIPNYLSGGAALAGWGFQVGGRGWPGLLNGSGGVALVKGKKYIRGNALPLSEVPQTMSDPGGANYGLLSAPRVVQ